MSISELQQRPLDATSTATARLYLSRTAFAWVWAGLLIAALSTADTLGPDTVPPAFAVFLLVLYPFIDALASLQDAAAHLRHGSRTDTTIQWVNAALSAVTALAVVITRDASTVLHAFGTWATVSGLIQLILGIIRLRQGRSGQWPMIASGGISTLAGFSFNLAATEADISLNSLAGYAFLGGLFYLVSALRLRRR